MRLSWNEIRVRAAQFGESYARIPIEKSPHILNADALETKWSDLIVPANCSYILGNPPFGGSKMQNPAQREQVRRVAKLGGSGGTLDYVTAWFITAGEYLGLSAARVGFVATNSITIRHRSQAAPAPRKTDQLNSMIY
jgi:hypothetical protein